jgi:phosphate transport system permease protein
LARIVDNEAGAGAHAAPTHRLWGAVLALILVVAFINIGARVIAGIYAPGKS